MTTLYITRDEILNAIDRIQFMHFRGLCAAFGSDVNVFIHATGGRPYAGYFWAPHFANPERLMFLAFMLCWHDELTGYNDDE